VPLNEIRRQVYLHSILAGLRQAEENLERLLVGPNWTLKFRGGHIRKRLKRGRKLVGATGFEPVTPCAQGRCATRLRYAPTLVLC
jgi:hypothetical protein